MLLHTAVCSKHNCYYPTQLPSPRVIVGGACIEIHDKLASMACQTNCVCVAKQLLCFMEKIRIY